MNDELERQIEAGLSVLGCVTATSGNLLGSLGGWETVALFGLSFALYQGTSLAKILREV